MCLALPHLRVGTAGAAVRAEAKAGGWETHPEQKALLGEAVSGPCRLPREGGLGPSGHPWLSRGVTPPPLWCPDLQPPIWILHGPAPASSLLPNSLVHLEGKNEHPTHSRPAPGIAGPSLSPRARSPPDGPVCHSKCRERQHTRSTAGLALPPLPGGSFSPPALPACQTHGASSSSTWSPPALQSAPCWLPWESHQPILPGHGPRRPSPPRPCPSTAAAAV